MKKISLLLGCAILLGFSACSNKKFIVHSYPEGAYIVGYGETSEEKPIDETIMFIGKSDSYDFIAMKRGYIPDTVRVTKESPAEVHIQLKAMDGIPPLIRKPLDLNLENTNLLPVNVEIVLHKGVGNLDKYEKSAELSRTASSEMNRELQAIQSDTTIHMLQIPENSDWSSASAELEDYLQSLSSDLLHYYPEAPSVAGIFEKYGELFAPLTDQLKQSGEEELLIFGWCKSVKPTTGRIVGNFSAAVASGVVSGYETAAYGYPVSYSDPSAFALDNSTLFVAYVIDPGTGEVLETRQYMVPYDITKTERLQTLSRSIIMFPRAEVNAL
jgi:hypothetical protein